ncbi:hypothetical protein OEZ86_013162 [Tetradesmus obliquus]|nr:hypothetical protein OEZ86_013162 [Tetradesmus obliquus]
MNERQLTVAVKNAATAERLGELATAYSHLLNPIHVAAIFRKLASMCQPPNPATDPAAAAAAAAVPAVAAAAAAARVSPEACEALLRQLQQQIKQQRCIGHGPRGIANILAAMAKLQCAPDTELLPMLLKCFCSQAARAVPQDVANVLWSVAQITLAFGVGSAPLAANGSSSSSSRTAQGVATAAAAAAAAAIDQDLVQDQGHSHFTQVQ